VSLLAFDNYPWTSLVEPGIDVLEQPIEEMGRTAAGILCDAIDRDGVASERRRFAARLIERGSCAAPRR
jgi:LacI family transcriptional regulator